MALRTRIKPICFSLSLVALYAVVMMGHGNVLNRRLMRFDSNAFDSVSKENNSSLSTVEDMESRAKQLRAEANSLNPLFPGVSKWTPFHSYFTTFYGCQTCPRVDKWEPYFEAYHRHFSKFRGKPVTFVEVGVQSGGSALMWRWYFGEYFRYIGVDINPNVKKFESDWATIVIGDQSSETFWEEFKTKFPEKVDIFLDDGGHTMEQQIVTISSMYTHVKHGGVYVCEDLATSYEVEFGGTPDFQMCPVKSGTAVGFAKSFVDLVNANFIDTERLDIASGQIAKTLDSVHFYNQLFVLEKSHGEARAPVTRHIFGKKIPYYSKPPFDPPEPLTLEMLKPREYRYI